jgi:hypothetical protein
MRQRQIASLEGGHAKLRGRFADYQRRILPDFGEALCTKMEFNCFQPKGGDAGGPDYAVTERAVMRSRAVDDPGTVVSSISGIVYNSGTQHFKAPLHRIEPPDRTGLGKLGISDGRPAHPHRR